MPTLAFAHEGVAVSNAWAPPSLNQPNAVGFLTLNASGDDALLSIKSDCCTVVEMHNMTMDNDVMRMRRVSKIALPDHQDVTLESGGYHLMLIGLKKPLEEGDSLPLTLNFEHAKPVVTQLKVQKREEASADMSHEHMGHH